MVVFERKQGCSRMEIKEEKAENKRESGDRLKKRYLKECVFKNGSASIMNNNRIAEKRK